MNLKSTNGEIDVFVCPDPSMQEGELMAHKPTQMEAPPTKVRKPDLDVSLASTASYMESPLTGSRGDRLMEEDQPYWDQNACISSSGDVEELLELLPENNVETGNYIPSLEDSSEGLYDLFDLPYT